MRIIDGTGLSGYHGDVRIVENRIAEIGEILPATGEKVTSGESMVLAPGFIDSHSHHDWGLDENPDCISATNQGITTIVVGQDGGSQPFDSLESGLMTIPPAVNVASFTGHSSLRSIAMCSFSTLTYSKATATDDGKTIIIAGHNR